MTRMRASATEKTLHWSVATAVLTLIATGTVMYVPWLSQVLGQRFLIRTAHLGAAVLLIAAMLVIPALRWKDVLRLERELSFWDSVDWDWFRRPWDVFRSVYKPASSARRRFNAGKKLLAVMVGVALALLLVSGAPMYSWWWFGGEVVQRARDLHVLASFALAALIAGHIYLAAFGPYGLLKSGSRHQTNPVLEDAPQ
jgi:formate dehydrogenase subunit gamma